MPIQPRFRNSGQDANVRFRPLQLEFQPGMWHRFGLLWRRCDTAYPAHGVLAVSADGALPEPMPHPRRTLIPLPQRTFIPNTEKGGHLKTRQPPFPHTSYIGNRNIEKNYLLTLLTVLPSRKALILSTVISIILCLEA